MDEGRRNEWNQRVASFDPLPTEATAKTEKVLTPTPHPMTNRPPIIPQTE